MFTLFCSAVLNPPAGDIDIVVLYCLAGATLLLIGGIIVARVLTVRKRKAAEQEAGPET